MYCDILCVCVCVFGSGSGSGLVRLQEPVMAILANGGFAGCSLLVCLTGIVPLDCSSYEKRVSVLVCSCWWNLETPTMCGC